MFTHFEKKDSYSSRKLFKSKNYSIFYNKSALLTKELFKAGSHSRKGNYSRKYGKSIE